jgi:hypothetical protein
VKTSAIIGDTVDRGRREEVGAGSQIADSGVKGRSRAASGQRSVAGKNPE